MVRLKLQYQALENIIQNIKNTYINLEKNLQKKKKKKKKKEQFNCTGICFYVKKKNYIVYFLRSTPTATPRRPVDLVH